MTTTTPGLVSVIIPTYYRNERLLKAIESVDAQTYDPVETIVVDGSATEHARSVVEPLDEVIYIPQAVDEGPHAARSLGIEQSKGEYIQLLDDDDTLVPEKFEKQISYLSDHPGIGVVYSGLRKEFGDVRMPDPAVQGSVLDEALTFGMSSCYNTTMLIRREVVDTIMPLKNRHGADDVGMKIELARVARFGFIDEVLIEMGEQEYNLGSSWDAVKGKQELLDRYDDLYAETSPDIRARAVAHIYANIGRRSLDEEVWSPKAIRAFAHAVRITPGFEPKYAIELLMALGGRVTYVPASRFWRFCMRFQ
jgi:glycosyltransferase involved in cell wall biosynthesis